MTSHEIRNTFLKFFESKGHKIFPSAPIVVKNDPTLMFTNAGMNQFKDLFLGNDTIKYSRITDTQKCLRVSGKHNDLEEVGVDTYHHTMFEMLGNWSFGDYFKKESISWGWELLTDIYKLPVDRLYVTVFEGDKNENIAFDFEAYDIWKNHIAEDRILKGNKKDNFWEMGETGPCGPCSEIHIDLRSDEERKKIDGKELVNAGDPQVIEIWNHVFIQFNRKADGSLEELPAKHVDTGMGFERLVRAIHLKSSNYDTDVFKPLLDKIEILCDKKYGIDEKTDIAFRVIADHIRAVSFCIADGQLPSNTGAGYVVRRILRRAIRYGFSFLELKKPFFNELVSVLALEFKEVFPELFAQKELVVKVISEEESSFLKTLDTGIKKLNTVEEELHKLNKKEISGTVAFELYDTYGFPLDLTKLIAREKNLDVDDDAFQIEMQKQKDRSRNASTTETEDWKIILDSNQVEFVGYDTTQCEAQILKMRSVKQKGETLNQIVLNKTPFYAESGGQVGDTGTLLIHGTSIQVTDTKKENNLIIHFTNVLPENPEGTLTATVNVKRREAIKNNHSATHLLHAALREVLGNHVQQKGSYVGPDRLRFDFSHFSKITPDELEKIETIINERIRENIPLNEKRNVPIEDAKKTGAMMLFGEKYGEFVRIITFNPTFSIELCGGTHVNATGNIGYCKLISETAVAAGIRRIEAITGEAVSIFINEILHELKEIGELSNSPNAALKGVKAIVASSKTANKELDRLYAKEIEYEKSRLLSHIQKQNHFSILTEISTLESAESIKKITYELRNETENLFCVLGAVINDNPFLSIIISDNLVAQYQLDASKIIRDIAKEIGGGGGGQKFYATAGGKNLAGLQTAIDKAKISLENYISI